MRIDMSSIYMIFADKTSSEHQNPAKPARDCSYCHYMCCSKFKERREGNHHTFNIHLSLLYVVRNIDKKRWTTACYKIDTDGRDNKG